ncbi:MAG: prepilin peptidase [Nitrosopumilus sp.]
MLELFQIRIIILLILFGIASIYDYKTRKIPDVLWIAFAGIGGVLYVIDYELFSAYHVISFFTSCFFGFTLYRFKFVGIADLLAIVSISVILPVHYEFVMIPIAVTVLALVLVVISVTIYNVMLNTIDLIAKRRVPFENFSKESLYRKIFAFFSIHKKRRYEKYVIISEKYFPVMPKNRSFTLISRSKEISQMKGERFVQNAPPFVLFMMIGIVLLLLPEILMLIISS